MGQYYFPIIIKNNKFNLDTARYGYSHDYDNGLKLTEHSWVGNHFVNAVLNSLEEGDRLLWFGDYAEFEDLTKNSDSIFSKEDFDEISFCFSNIRSIDKVEDPSKYNRFVVNKTKKEYIDLTEYAAWAPKDEFDWVMHPVPLLTAIGNGKGGGDYWSSHPDFDSVGTWAGDEIYTTNELSVSDDYRNASKDYLFYDGPADDERLEKYYEE